MRENSDDVSITASGAQLLQCQVGGVSAIRDPRIRDDLCPCCEPVVLQGLSLCTKPSSQTHFPHPCPRNTTCFLSREVCLPYNPKALSGPGCPFPPELPTQLQGTHYRGAHLARLVLSSGMQSTLPLPIQSSGRNSRPGPKPSQPSLSIKRHKDPELHLHPDPTPRGPLCVAMVPVKPVLVWHVCKIPPLFTCCKK